MTTMTIPKSIFQNDDLVIMPRRHYEELRAKIPVYFLTGRAAKRIDKRVTASLRAYQKGKCQKIESLSELM